MERFGMGLRGPALAVVLAWVAGCSLSNTSYPAASGTGGTTDLVGPGGAAGQGGAASGEPADASPCGHLFAVCASWCGVDALAGDGGAAFSLQICGPDGSMCPGDLVDIGTCPRNSCARQRTWCCDPASGDTTLGACQADGTRGCPLGAAGSSYLQCVPPALGISTCFTLDRQPCTGDVHACHDVGADCSCQSVEGSGMIWVCRQRPPIP